MSNQTLSSYSGFSNGVMIRGVPIVQTHPGRVFWVYNGTVLNGQNHSNGSNGNDGTFRRPYATVQYAITQCSAGRGDVVVVRPGHAETIADAATLSLNVAGVAVIGLGSGSNRPTFTFTTANTANIPVTAKDVTMQNFLFVANFLNIASVFTATGTATPTDLTIDNCEFRDTTSSLNFVAVVTGNATANSMDGLNFTNCRVSSLGTTAATTAIIFTAAADRVKIADNYGNWAVLNDTAAILATGANNVTNFDFARNKLQRPNTSSVGGSFISTSGTGWTGHCYDNYLYQLDASAGIWIATGTKLGFSNNFSPITGAADKSGLINPAAV